MRKIGLTLGLFLLVSLLAAGVYAAGHPTAGKKKNEAGIYKGIVTELDLKKSKMILTKTNTDLAMVFNISRAKAGSGYKDLSELKVGDQVAVKFEAKVGIIYALTISKDNKVGEEAKAAAKAPHPATR